MGTEQFGDEQLEQFGDVALSVTFGTAWGCQTVSKLNSCTTEVRGGRLLTDFSSLFVQNRTVPTTDQLYQNLFTQSDVALSVTFY